MSARIQADSSPEAALPLSSDGDPTYVQALAAIDSCRSASPPWLTDLTQREDRVFAIARADVDARQRSPRSGAAKRMLDVIKHHDLLGDLRAGLQGAAARFVGDRGAADAALSHARAALQPVESAGAAATEKHGQAQARVAELESTLSQSCASAAARVNDTHRRLRAAIAAGDDAAMLKEADLLAKARRQLDAANAAANMGAQAEMLAAQRGRIAVTELDADAADGRLKDAQAALSSAERQAAQIEVDSALGEAADRIVGAAFRASQVGVVEHGAALTVPGADARRVPLVGDGLRVLLSVLYPPDYALLDVDLAALPDGNEPGERPAPFYDEVLTRAANRGVQSYPEIPPRPGERPPSVTYSDPDAARHARMVTRVQG